jgi:hypothetical protein
MSAINDNKKENRGGPREGTGPKLGSGKKKKISVSVDKSNWQAALSRWQDKGSQLVDRLVLRYNETEGSILKREGAI